MIPYELVVPSASRPHLLGPTLRSLLAAVDAAPTRIWVHDDPVFPGRQDQVCRAVAEAVELAAPRLGYIPYHVECNPGPPIGHGPALCRLLRCVRADYVLYSQDDHEVVRPLPVARALRVMDQHGLHQIRFNKRDTLPAKETWQGPWQKIERPLTVREPDGTEIPQVVTVADHWYFQTGLWYVAPIRAVLDWLAADPQEGPWLREHVEAKVNRVMDGQWPGFPEGLIDLPPAHLGERDQATRAAVQRTYIWGGIDEKAYVRHLGGKPEDWAMTRERLELGGGPIRLPGGGE